METTKFETGNIYEMRFVTDSDLKPHFICTKRTDKTVTFESFKGSEVISKKVRVYEGVEYIVTDSYSMAPVIKANRIVG